MSNSNAATWLMVEASKISVGLHDLCLFFIVIKGNIRISLHRLSLFSVLFDVYLQDRTWKNSHKTLKGAKAKNLCVNTACCETANGLLCLQPETFVLDQ